jgi:hypothetical protein
MRTLSMLLALGFILAGTSVAGSQQGSLPGVGTFSYLGSAMPASAQDAATVAARF